MPRLSLRNPHLIIVAALLVVVLGVMAFARMPVDVFPRLYIKAAVVATFYPVAPGGPARAGLLRWLRMVAEGGSVFLN
jgi:multidrug efflux pump subunit AcrB